MEDHSSKEIGSTVVEAVLVLPIAMLAVLFAIQACLWAHAATVVQNAASQGDQVATEAGSSLLAGTEQADSVLAGNAAHLVVDPSVQVEQLSGGEIRMTVSGRAESIIPGLHLPVSAVRVADLQEFRLSG